MKIKTTKELFKSFKGLEKLNTMKEERYCNNIDCKKCPLDKSNLNDSLDCADILDLNGYAAGDLNEMKKLNKIIDIFTEEKINKNLSLIDERLKYNSKVMYNGKSYMIKGTLKKKFIGNKQDPILLDGFSDRYNAIYDDCNVRECDMKKKYTLWVDIKNIEI